MGASPCCCRDKEGENAKSSPRQSSTATRGDSEEISPRPLGRSRGSRLHAEQAHPDQAELHKHYFSHAFAQEREGKIQEFYEMNASKTLGEGGAGVVRKAENKTTKVTRAVKLINWARMSEDEQEALKIEVGIMKLMDHPHIIKLYEIFRDAQFLYLVMELCTGGDLFDRILQEVGSKGYSEDRAALYMRQVLSAICYVHHHDITHRDIKPENLILEDDKQDSALKLIDFGIAAKARGKSLTACVGTITYVAPEVLKGSYYDHKVDIWSCGVLAFCLLSGHLPFCGKNDNIIMQNVLAGRYSFDAVLWKGVSQQAKDFISAMLTTDVTKRPEADELLKDPWLSGQCPSRRLSISPTVASSFKSFDHARKLRKITLTLIASKLNGPALHKLRDQFEGLDDNGDGTLSREELAKGLNDANMDEEVIDSFMSSIDSDGSGEIDYTEFIAAAISRQQFNSQAVLWDAFRDFDLDGNGKITRDEMKTMLSNGSGLDVPPERVNELIAEADLDGDGEIDFEEFLKLMAPSRPLSRQVSPISRQCSPAGG